MTRFTARKRRAVRAASIMRRASASVVASGFSQSTCLPASSAAIASSLCVEGGVAIWMICTSSRAASAWMSAQTGTANSLPALRAASGIVSATAAARSPGAAANSRRQKRPNAPHPSSPTPSFAPGMIGFEGHDVSASVDVSTASEQWLNYHKMFGHVKDRVLEDTGAVCHLKQVIKIQQWQMMRAIFQRHPPQKLFVDGRSNALVRARSFPCTDALPLTRSCCVLVSTLFRASRS